MSGLYDEWKARITTTDECTGDCTICPCPDCRDWRDQQEPERDPDPVTVEEQYAAACREREEIER